MDINYYKKYEPLFGAWEIKRMLGEGGFGQVYEIERNELGQTYRAALKTITVPKTQSELNSVKAECGNDENVTTYYKDLVNDMMNEFVLMSRVKGNSNIVSYEDHQIIPHKDGIGWDILIRMELLTPMEDYFKGREVTETDVINLGIDICRALELCQKNNIIHRDVKPENIFMSHNGDYKLGDFGIARTIEKTTSGLTRTGSVPYIAPEIWTGNTYGPTVDIYSLGLVMYKLLNHGRAPFMPEYPKPVGYGDSSEASKKRLQGEVIPAPMAASEDLAKVVLKACAYEPAERYQTATEMKLALEAVLNGRGTGEQNVIEEHISVEPVVTEILPDGSEVTEILPDIPGREQEVTEILPDAPGLGTEVTEILPDESSVDPDVTQTISGSGLMDELAGPILQPDEEDDDDDDNGPEKVINDMPETKAGNGSKKFIIIAIAAVLIAVIAVILLLPKGAEDTTGTDEQIKIESESEDKEETEPYDSTKSYNKEYYKKTEPAEPATEPVTEETESTEEETEAATDVEEETEPATEPPEEETEGEWWYYEEDLYVPQESTDE